MRILCSRLLVVALAVAVGCSQVTLDASNRPCNEGACGDDYTCDEATDTCITIGDTCSPTGATSPCTPGESSCELGCRTCRDGAWSDCITPLDVECVNGELSCDGAGNLVRCDELGTIVETTACGAPGCNDARTPNGCNACIPGTTYCDGTLFTACDDDGLITGFEECDTTGNQCADVGICESSGCQILPFAPNGTPCDDGDACTEPDVCNAGACLPGAALSCDDANPCTDDSCDDVAGCQFANNAAACNDGTVCTATDTCAGGACVGGNPLDCDDGDSCTEDDCDPASGCTHVNTCPCTSPAECDDSNPCTDDTCDGTCANTPNSAGCDDGDPCTVGDVCNGGGCVSGSLDDCDDTNACTTDSCVTGTGCSNVNNTADCNDGDPCTLIDQCSGGGCVGSAPDACSDGDVCTDDTCVAMVGCENPNNSANCDDDDPCTLTDVCNAGTCVGSDIDACDDGEPCTDDDCLTGVGCDHANNTLACIDGDVCTVGDQCGGGACQAGPAPDCSATASDCREVSTCNPLGAPGNCATPGAAINDGVACDDCALGPPYCTTCNAGTCGTFTTCDGAVTSTACTTGAVCAFDANCVDTPGDCLTIGCTGQTFVGDEHQACADTQELFIWGPGLPCESVDCTGDAATLGDTAVGADCYADAATVRIVYTFNTASPTGTAFNIWMRNVVDEDWDVGEYYACSLTGVDGTGKLTFSFRPGGLDGVARHGTGCGNYDGTPKYCWMAVDGDTDATTYDPVALSSGPHVLDCSITTNNGSGANTESGGYDGIIFTTDLSFVPEEADAPPACSDSDFSFTTGICSTNWGPNASPLMTSGGYCSDDIELADGSPCSSAGTTCCDGVCVDLGMWAETCP